MAPASNSISTGDALKDVCEAIWQIEDELDLFRQQVGGVYFWRIARWEACRVLAHQRDRHNGEPGQSEGLGASRIRHELAALRKRFGTPSWSAAGPVDTILVPFPRKQVRDGMVGDIHSQAVLDEPAFGKILVLERTDAQQHLPRSDRVFIADRDRDRAEAIARAVVSYPLLLGALAPIRRSLDDACQRHLGLSFPISLQNLALRTALFVENRRIFRRLLRATNAKRFIAAWQDQALFAAARDIGMESVELQHAAFSPYNPHYHFPRSGAVPYFADRFLAFAPYWLECVTLPSNTRASVLGSTNMAALRSAVTERQMRTVVIASQGPTYWPLFDCSFESAAKAEGWNFVFRPHPREDFEAYQTRLAARTAHPNFRLSAPDEDLYELIASADVQIGMASTALFEGMALGCRTIVFQSPVTPSMDAVVAAGDAVIASNSDGIVKGLDDAPAASRPLRYYAPPRPILEALGD